MIYKILQKLYIVQVVSNDKRHKQGLKSLGQGYSEAFRLNKFNPLSYLFIIIVFVIVLLMSGLLGVYEAVSKNPFKWN